MTVYTNDHKEEAVQMELFELPVRPVARNTSALMAKDMFMPTNRLNLSVYSRKLLFAMIANLDRDASEFGIHKEDIKVFFRYLGIEKTNKKYNIVRDAFFELLDCKFQRRKEKSWYGVNLMSMVEFDEQKSSDILYKFNQDMAPYLLNLTEFLKIDLIYSNNMKSDNALSLYPYFRNVVNRDVNFLTLTFQQIVELTGNEEKKSYRFCRDLSIDEKEREKINKTVRGNITRHILGLSSTKYKDTYDTIPKKGIGEINDVSDLFITAKPYLVSGKIEGFKFFIEFKKDNKGWVDKRIRKIKKTDYKGKPFMQEMLIEEARRFNEAIQEDTIEKFAIKAEMTPANLAKLCGLKYSKSIILSEEVSPTENVLMQSPISLKERAADIEDNQIFHINDFREYHALTRQQISLEDFIKDKGYQISEDKTYCVKVDKRKSDIEVQKLLHSFKKVYQS